MLTQVLRVSPLELRYSHIRDLVDSGRSEGQHLDFKQEPPAGNKLASVFAAMANGGGGLIVLGVDAPNLRAKSIIPVPLDQTITKIENVLADKVEPIMLPNFYPLPCEPESDLGVVVAEVPQSEFTPFAIKMGEGLYRFDRRVGQRAVRMSESMIEAMYRDRFFRTEQLSNRLNDLAPATIISPLRGGYIYVAGVPVLRPRLFAPSTLSVPGLAESVSKLLPDPIFELEPDGAGITFIPGISPRVRYRRMVIRNAAGREWSFFDDGSFKARILPKNISPSAPVSRPYFHFTTLVAQFLAILSSYWAVACHFGVSGELVLRVGLHGSSTKLARYAGKEDPDRDGTIEEDVHSDHSLIIDDLKPEAKLIRTAKPLLDDVFAGFGVAEGCPLISPDGKLDPLAFDLDLSKGAYRWAITNNVPLTDTGYRVLEANPEWLEPEQ